MKVKVFCKTTEKGKQTFYLTVEGSIYYLFTQDYRVSVKEYFSRGLSVNELFNGTGRRNLAVCKTKEKIINYVKYIEKEFNLCLLKSTEKRLSKNKYAA
ncbi:MAG: hypothetical protein J6B04_06365 [Clostridia bacterium]|nr:hypothetical protein [Clostridia bacterium]